MAVLDGASTPDPVERDGGWYAGELAGQLADRLADTRLDLPTVLADSIAAVASGHRLVPGRSPSSTVAMLRWTGDRAEGLVLGDSSLVVFSAAGTAEEVVDDRLAEVAPGQRVAYHDRLSAGGGYDDAHRSLLRQLVGEQRRHRNSPGGYWIAEAEPAAARHALTRSWPAETLAAAVLATDGVTRGLRRAGLPTWSATLRPPRRERADRGAGRGPRGRGRRSGRAPVAAQQAARRPGPRGRHLDLTAGRLGLVG